MLVRVDEDSAYYPDVTVTCDADDTEPLFKTRPCLVVEVVSPSTSGTDLREKALEYRRIETLRSYVIVFQDERRVIHNYNDSDGVWRQEIIEGDGEMHVHYPEATLDLRQIYRGIPNAPH